MHEFNDACVKTSDQSLTKDATIDLFNTVLTWSTAMSIVHVIILGEET